jgi:soluble lytic murein transglycosylase-like protein
LTVRRAVLAVLGVVLLIAVALAALLVMVPAGAAEKSPPAPFAKGGRGGFAPSPAATRWRAELTRQAHAQWGLDAPVPALAAQVHQESGWRADAVSRVGAAGMAQFMPGTARWWCDLNRLSATDCRPANPRWALRALVGYDKWLFDRLGAAGEPSDRLWAALRAYNGGLGHWQAEARLAAGPLRSQIDAACGRARRAPVHCAENLGYPRRILAELQSRYSTWGAVWSVPAE